MSLPLEELEAEALDLSTKERAQLAHRLLESLDQEPADDPTRIQLPRYAKARERLRQLSWL